MDNRSLAHTERTVAAKERRSCFYCLEGWVFLGSLDNDGREVIEAIRCRRCKGTGWIDVAGDVEDL